MVYYKLIMDTRRHKTDGLYPIFVRISYNKNNTTITTGVRVKKEHWDGSNQLVTRLNKNFQKLNQSISELYLKIQKVILRLQESGEFSFERLKDQLSNKPVIKEREVTFYDFSNKLIKDMMELNQTGNALIYQTAMNRFILYSSQSVRFSEIDYNLLLGYKQSLLLTGLKANTISNYFRTIKAIYNKAIKAKLVDRSLYPFLDIPIKQERTPKRAIGIEEIQALLKLDLRPNSALWDARNYFMLSFCLIGISFTDLAYLKPTDVVKGRLIFNRRKTHKSYDIKLTPHALSILNIYKKNNSPYLLSVFSTTADEDSLVSKKIIHQWIKTTNKYLKRLGEDIDLESPLTTYVARHTWATTAKKMGYSNELIAEAMGHEFGNKITSIYLDSFDQEVIDSLNKTVIQACF